MRCNTRCGTSGWRAGAWLIASFIASGCTDKHVAPRQDVRGGIARQLNAPAPQAKFGAAAAPMPGALDYLSAYAGRDSTQAGLWTTRPLHERLQAMLGVEYDRFIAQMPAAKLASDAGIYYVAGRTEGGVAAIVIDPHADSIYAVEQDRSRLPCAICWFRCRCADCRD